MVAVGEHAADDAEDHDGEGGYDDAVADENVSEYSYSWSPMILSLSRRWHTMSMR